MIDYGGAIMRVCSWKPPDTSLGVAVEEELALKTASEQQPHGGGLREA